MYMNALWVYGYHLHAGAHRSQKRVPHPLTLESQNVRFYVGAADWTLVVFCESSKGSEELSHLHTQNSTFWKKSQWRYRLSHRNRSYLENSSSVFSGTFSVSLVKL